MPKDSTYYQTTTFYSKQIVYILVTRLEIVVPYSCYKKEGLKCISKLIIRYYAYYICAKAQCSLVFFNTKRKEINNKQLATQLRIARAKAKLAAAKLSLLESKARKQKQELKEITTIKELERLKDAARMLKELPLLEPVTRTANFNFLDLELLTNLGQLQANLTLFTNPSFLNALFLLPTQDFAIRGSLCKSP